MRFTQIFGNSVVVLATLGIALPNAGIALAATPVSGVKDVALEQGGALRGQVISAQGVVRPGSRVSILHQGRQVAEVATDKQGRFIATGLTGGIYVVAAQGTGEVVRAWTAEAAPPIAARGLLLVPQGEVTNGTHEHGDHEGHGLGNFNLYEMGFGALIIGAAITTIIVVASNKSSSS